MKKFVILLGLAFLSFGFAQEQNCEDGFKLLDHEMLATDPVCIPENPERIVMLDYNAIEEVVALGKTPVGIMYESQSHLADELANAEIVGVEGDPSLEQILLLEPDLILAWEPFMSSDLPNQLSQIAPTVISNRQGFGEWKTSLRFTAEAVGESAAAEELLADYGERVAALQANLGEARIADTTLTVFAAFSESSGLRFYVESFPNTVLSDVGFSPPAAQQELILDDLGEASGLTLEQLDLVEADYTFFVKAPWSDEDYLNSLETGPLWQQLDVVEEGNVCDVEYTWAEGSIVAANIILDELETCLSNP